MSAGSILIDGRWWRPAATAPKDGSSFMVRRRDRRPNPPKTGSRVFRPEVVVSFRHESAPGNPIWNNRSVAGSYIHLEEMLGWMTLSEYGPPPR